MGGTTWGDISAQYYQSNYNGTYSTVGNPKQELAGVWNDNINPIHDNLAPTDLASEAARAVQYFHATDLANSNFVIATPQKFNDAGFNQANTAPGTITRRRRVIPGCSKASPSPTCLCAECWRRMRAGLRQSRADGRC